MRRYSVATAFNKRSNNPTRKHHHPLYHPLRMVPNAALKDCENKFESTEEKWFMDPDIDTSYDVEKKE